MSSHVVITGVAAITPRNAAETAPGRIEGIAAADAGQPASRSEHNRHTRLSRLTLAVVRACLSDAELRLEAGPDATVGLVGASSYGCVDTTDGIFRTMREKGPAAIDAVEFAKATHVFPLTATATELGIAGPVTAFVSSASASVEALAFARDLIQAGQCGAMLVVGFEEITEVVARNLAARGLLPLPSPVTPRIGEGMAAILLESAEAAAARGALARAELRTIAIRCLTAADPIDQIERTMHRALDGLELSTSSPASIILSGDVAAGVEREALRRVAARRPIGDVRTPPCWLGNQLGASMAVRLATLLDGGRVPSDARAPILLNAIDTRGNAAAVGILTAARGFEERAP
jgi:3-oxoacyl-(acyl-carrier-protein) synthase